MTITLKKTIVVDIDKEDLLNQLTDKEIETEVNHRNLMINNLIDFDEDDIILHLENCGWIVTHPSDKDEIVKTHNYQNCLHAFQRGDREETIILLERVLSEEFKGLTDLLRKEK